MMFCRRKYSKKIFAKKIKSKGGAFELHRDESRVKLDSRMVIFQMAEKLAQNHINAFVNSETLLRKKPVVQFEIIDNPKFNAFAYKHPRYNAYLVGINSGAIYLLFDLFNKALANKNILTDIGDPDKELYAGKITDSYFLNADNLFQSRFLAEQSYALIQPKDLERRKYAQKLFRYSVEFIVGHEIHHIRNGHIDYHYADTGFSYLDEISYLPTEKVSFSNNYHAREADADAGSANVGIRTILTHLHSSEEASSIDFIRSAKDTFNQWLFAISTTYRLMIQPFSNNSSKTHPHPRFRQIYFLSKVDEVTKVLYPRLYADVNFSELMLESVRLSEFTFKELTGIRISQKLSEEQLEESKELLKSTAKYRELLRPYTYVSRENGED